MPKLSEKEIKKINKRHVTIYSRLNAVYTHTYIYTLAHV